MRSHVRLVSLARLTLTVEEAAERLGISRNHAYASVKSGAIPAIRIGRRLLVPKAALERKLAIQDAFAEAGFNLSAPSR
jgi:excisionase family DNA binding protein